MGFKRNCAFACATVVGMVITGGARGDLVVADFNDLAPGQLFGQAGGTGLSGTWGASTLPEAVGGDLTAPAATNYAVPQSAGTPQSIRTTANSNSGNGQASRPVAAPLSGTVWFSFLLNAPDANSRTGISFNSTGSGAGGARMDASGTSFFISYGLGVTQPNRFTLGQTALVVGQVVVDENGTNDRLRLWINPDVNTLTEETTTNRVFDASDMNWVNSSITSLALQSYGNNTSGGIVDAVRLSDGPDAFFNVTGVPEPTGLGLVLLGGVGLVARRRRAVK
jgi:hypothetical protein